ncbi:MAG: hypothetical protein RL226_415 [Bacteroidota bacterium]
MKTIELQTTQNVTINYEVAYTRDRVFAFLIDALILTVVTVLCSIVLFTSSDAETNEVLFFLFVMPIMTFYTLAWEFFTGGQTPGKMLFRLKVVRADGKQVTFIDYLLRWTLRLIDIWLTMGAVGVLLISSTTRSQRLGGIISNTLVVKSSPDLHVTLNDILKISTVETHEVLYPQVRFFSEDDMLLIKNTIDRYQLYRNEAHAEALDTLVERVCEELELQPIKENQIGFLRALLKDYIVLTR